MGCCNSNCHNIPELEKYDSQDSAIALMLKVYRYAKQLGDLISELGLSNNDEIKKLYAEISRLDVRIDNIPALLEKYKCVVDTILTKNGKNPVAGGAIYDALEKLRNELKELGSKCDCVIDDALSETSDNAVKNKVIAKVIKNIFNRLDEVESVDSLVIDDALSETSDNAVKNKVIALAIKELKENISNLGLLNGIKVVTVYRISNTKPAKPVGGEYDFTTGIFRAPTDWFTSVNPEEGDIVWGCLGIVYSNSKTIEWQDPFRVNGTEGGNSTGSVNVVTARVPIIYKSSITKPSTPVGGVYNFESDTFTAPNGWKKDKSSFTDYDVVWMSIGSATSDDVNIKWSEPIRISGGSGSSILKRAKILTIYTSSVENPGTPSGGSYDFITEKFVAPTNWQTEDNFSEGSIVWMSIGTIYEGDTNIDWSKPIRISGGAGSSIIRRSKILSIYKASPTTPLTPSGGSYDFDTNTLTVPTGWTENSSSFEDGEIVWLSIGNVVQGDNIINWSKPLRITPGVGSANITIAFVAAIYINSETKPDTPTGGSYNFETKELTPPNGWSKDALSGDDAWFSVRVFYKNGTETSWSEPKPAASADVTLTAANLEVIAQKVKLTTNELDIIAGRVNLDAQQLNIISQNVQLTTDNLITIADNIDVSAINLDVLAQKINLTTQELNTIAANVNLQANQLDIIAGKVQLDAEDLQIVSENVVLTTDQLRFIADNINLETIDYSVLARNITLTSSELSIVAGNVKFTHNELLTIANNVTLHTEELSVIAEYVHFSADDLQVVADKVSLSSAQLDVIAQNVTLTTANLDTIAKNVTLRTEDLNTIAGKVNLSTEQLGIIAGNVSLTNEQLAVVAGNVSLSTANLNTIASKVTFTTEQLNNIASKVTFTTDQLEIIAGNTNITLSDSQLNTIASKVNLTTEQLEIIAGNANVTFTEDQLSAIADNVSLTADNITTIASKVSFTTEQLNSIANKLTLTTEQLEIIAGNANVTISDSQIISAIENSTGSASAIIQAINNGTSSVTIKADKIYLDGEVIANGISKKELVLKDDNGYIGVTLRGDGSGFLARRKISWTKDGELTIAGWTINETSIVGGYTSLYKDGNIVNFMGTTTFWKLGTDGSGLLARGNISWDTLGNVNLGGKIKINGNTTIAGDVSVFGLCLNAIVSSSITGDVDPFSNGSNIFIYTGSEDTYYYLPSSAKAGAIKFIQSINANVIVHSWSNNKIYYNEECSSTMNIGKRPCILFFDGTDWHAVFNN